MFFDTADLRTDEIYLKLEKTSEANSEKRWVPAYHFKICLAGDGEEAGQRDLRIGNTEKLFFGGNIGYEVYERYRGNHYAGKACLLLLRLAKKHGLPYLYITCSPDNHASRKTCEYAGGSLLCIVDTPTDNDLYSRDRRQTCIYRFVIC